MKKDTVIFVNNHLLSMNEETWGADPDDFRPSRFLKKDDDGEDDQLRFMRPKEFKPFSLGKRACMGFGLVENVSLAMIAGILRDFELGPPLGGGGVTKLPRGLLGSTLR